MTNFLALFARRLGINLLLAGTIALLVGAVMVNTPATLSYRPDPVKDLAAGHLCWTDDGHAHPDPNFAILRTDSGAPIRVSVDRAFNHLDKTLLFCR